MLKTFVSEEDYPQLIDILKKIHNKTLKKDVSIVNIYGDSGSGKSTLLTIMEQIGKLPYFNYGSSRFLTPRHLEILKKDAVMSGNERETNIHYLKKINIIINRGITIKDNYSSTIISINPASMIFESNYKIDFDSSMKRKPVNIYLPNKFGYKFDIFVIKNMKTREKVIETCVKEFYNILKEEECLKAVIETRNIMKKFLIKDMTELLGKYVYETKEDDCWLKTN